MPSRGTPATKATPSGAKEPKTAVWASAKPETSVKACRRRKRAAAGISRGNARTKLSACPLFFMLKHHALQKLGLSSRRRERLSCHYRRCFAKFVSEHDVEERRIPCYISILSIYSHIHKAI